MDANGREWLPRLFWVKATICFGLMAGLILSFHLWVGPRLYPVTPVFSAFGTLPLWLEYVVFAAMILLLGIIVVVDVPGFTFGFVALAVASALFDQSRWQPWFYQYLIMLVAVGLRRLDACRLIIVCIYFWSGVQKINPGFLHDTFPWMMGPAAHFVPAWAAPLTEAAIGIGLATLRFRKVAVVMAVAMHVVILISIGPFGHNLNSVVWPWNAAMCAFGILLFWRTQDVAVRDGFLTAVLVLFGIMPALSLVDLWDSYLSFALYSGNQIKATIYMDDTVAGELPGKIQEVIDTNESKVDALDFREWSYSELNVPPYPETRVFLNVGKQVCGYAGNSPLMAMVLEGKRGWFHRQRMDIYNCARLSGVVER